MASGNIEGEGKEPVSSSADSSTLRSMDTPELSHRYSQQISKPPERLMYS